MRILSILDTLETAPFILETTSTLADRLGCGSVRLLHPAPASNPDFQSPDEGMPGPQAQARFAQSVTAQTTALHTLCQNWMATSGHARISHWATGQEDNIRALVAAEAASADLVVLSRPRATDPASVSQAFSGALYDAKAAVVVAPLQSYPTMGSHPIVAWKASDMLDRALEHAMPLLEKAATVTILIGERQAGEEATPTLAQTLRQKGVAVTIQRFVITSRTEVGEQIRAQALSAGGDLLVMGAYSQPHFLEWLFGGPTRDILRHGTLPILTHH